MKNIIKENEYSKLYELNNKAIEFYQLCLNRSYNTALTYLSKRDILLKTIKEFEIGYANNDYNLYEWLKMENYSDEIILKSGLIIKDENGNYIERFKNRIIFPIKDENNNIIAFGGRVLDDTIKPKYINSPDNIINTKANSLYGINIAKNYADSGIIVVEGYIDLISLYQAGFKNVVALIGTAITDEQIELIKKYTKKITLIFDSDMAGQCAAQRAIEKLEKYGMEYSNIKLEKTKDVDELINKFGVEEFIKMLNC